MAEHPNDRIQFTPASPEIVAGHDEIGGAEGRRSGEEKAVLAIPKSMVARSFWHCRGLRRLDH
jgi:hypothetical protein